MLTPYIQLGVEITFMHLKKGGKYKEKHRSLQEEEQDNFATQRQQPKHKITLVSQHYQTVIALVIYFNYLAVKLYTIFYSI